VLLQVRTKQLEKIIEPSKIARYNIEPFENIDAENQYSQERIHLVLVDAHPVLHE
jgi:hypothetical protein